MSWFAKNKMLVITLFALLVAGSLWWISPPAWLAGDGHAISYNKDVRPILNDKCLACHGGVRQAGGFSLLFAEEALRPNESGKPAFIAGAPDESELIRRVRHTDPEERMPLDHPALEEHEIEILEAWIAEGAAWETHWAYVAPEEKQLPKNRNRQWAKNGIDRFVLSGLEAAGLQPAPEATCTTLMRRASLDLTGLPPAPEAVDTFCADLSENAYEKVVDELLASPRFGERWAAMWLDLARYADSKGYEKDGPRTIWKYRDWVIQAFNRDLPFDTFTVEQLAGDLLPNPTEDQLIATAFHRNTMNNDEGGTDDEEFRMASVIDRTNTTWEVWMGTTMACVQCHSHPYDPFTQQEYYEFLAFFNNTADQDTPDESPTLKTYADSNRADVEALVSWLAKQQNLEIAHHALGIQVDTLLSVVDVAALPALQEKVESLTNIQPESRTPIYQEITGAGLRDTRVLNRGNFLDPLEVVAPGTPAVMPAFPADAPRNRLSLAKWIVDGDNPLTARVMVNRFWEQLFGIGIIETTEDFGTQSLAASDPELLDWLALQFSRTHNWRVKAFLKEIVMSATYRQAFDGALEKLAIDPNNRLFSRGPRIRLSAEQIRDQALAVSGLLSDKMYGPSVYPYQPAGIWNAPYSSMTWEVSEGEDRHRRGLYTYWRRSAPYPSMMAFDSPSRELCVSRRITTNTPLQALVTLNDPVFVEAAEALALRVLEEGIEALDGQLIRAFKLALVRDPVPAELAALRTLYREAYFEAQDRGGNDVMRGNTPAIASSTVAAPAALVADPQVAAFTVVANAILNLDEFIMKG
ncbi:MAG: PSD1 and planctomycete cytochrome C domain-containing protein [Bacteroidota bacterium]